MMSLKRILSLLLFLTIGSAIIRYYLDHKEEFYLITSVDSGAIAVISALIITNSLLYGFQLKILLDHYAIKISFIQCYSLVRASNVLNLFIPMGGGTSIKALYLKKLHDLRYSSFLASMGISNVIKVMVNALFALLIMASDPNIRGSLLTAVSAGILCASAFFLFLGHKASRFNFTSAGYISNLLSEWQRLRNDHLTVIKLVATSTLIFLVTSVRLYLSFQVFSSPVSLATSGIISSFTIISGALNLVPGNLGIKEALIISLATMQGTEVNAGVHAAALDRILTTAWTLLISLCLSFKYPLKKEDANVGLQ